MKRLVVVAALAFILAMNGTVFAQQFHLGTITTYHLNSEIAGRGPCVLTDPPPEASTEWICLHKINPLYEEIKELLRDATINLWGCRFDWTVEDAHGHIDLAWLTCPHPAP